MFGFFSNSNPGNTFKPMPSFGTINHTGPVTITGAMTYTGAVGITGTFTQATGKAQFTPTQTVASASGALNDAFDINDTTITVTGTTQVTTATGFNFVNIGRPTYTDASAVTIDYGATVYIKNAPLAGGSVTLTNPYAIWVDDGAVRLDGTLAAGATTITGAITQSGGQNTFAFSGNFANTTYVADLTGTMSTDADRGAGAIATRPGVLRATYNLTGAATGSNNVFHNGSIFKFSSTAAHNTSGSIQCSGVYNEMTFTGITAGTAIIHGLRNSLTVDNSVTTAYSAYALNTIASIISTGTYNYYGKYGAVVKTLADTGGTVNLYGVYGSASHTGQTDAGTQNTYGGYFSAAGATNGTSTCYGVYSTASGADTNYSFYGASGRLKFIPTETIASATSAVCDVFDMAAATITVSGSTAITTAAGFNVANFRVSNFATAANITNAATVYIAGAPTISGGGAISNAYALWVGAGTSKFEGIVDAQTAGLKIKQTTSELGGAAPSQAEMVALYGAANVNKGRIELFTDTTTATISGVAFSDGVSWFYILGTVGA